MALHIAFNWQPKRLCIGEKLCICFVITKSVDKNVDLYFLKIVREVN